MENKRIVKHSIKANFAYNIIYQCIAIIIPLITSPYVSRALGAEKIGINSWTYSVAYYFMILAILGINNYGNRTIAACRDNFDNRSKAFFSIYAVQITMSTLMVIAYIVYVLFFSTRYKEIAFIQIFQILANAFDITWFFYGLEEFKVITTRNSIIKLAGLLLIFGFVRTGDDLWKYSLIVAGSAFLGQLSIWPLLRNRVKFVKISFNDVKVHIKPILILFIPVLAISIFANMDKVMIGQMSTIEQSGFYENTDKIIGVPKAVITALGTVMLPRTANLIANGDEAKSNYYIELTMAFTMITGFAFVFGISSVARMFSVVFWGKEFAPCGELIATMSPAILFSVFGNVIRTQYLIPRALDKEYTISLIVGAVVNLIVNYTLIPILGAEGAVIGTVISEFVMTFLQTWFVRKNLLILEYLKNGIPFAIIGALMFAVVRAFVSNSVYTLTNLLLAIIIGATVYSVLTILILKRSNNKIYNQIYLSIVNSMLRKNRK